MSKEVVTKKDRDESIELYMGEENIRHLKSITKEELDLFNSFNIDISKSYVVKGTEEVLRKFKAFFTAHCTYERLSYATFMLNEYATSLFNGSTDESFLSSSERELLFIYLHGNKSGTEKMEEWKYSVILDRVANRNRKGLITVILSERDVPTLENAKTEFKTINLGGSVAVRRVESVASTFKTSDSNKRCMSVGLDAGLAE